MRNKLFLISVISFLFSCAEELDNNDQLKESESETYYISVYPRIIISDLNNDRLQVTSVLLETNGFKFTVDQFGVDYNSRSYTQYKLQKFIWHEAGSFSTEYLSLPFIWLDNIPLVENNIYIQVKNIVVTGVLISNDSEIPFNIVFSDIDPVYLGSMLTYKDPDNDYSDKTIYVFFDVLHLLKDLPLLYEDILKEFESISPSVDDSRLNVIFNTSLPEPDYRGSFDLYL